MSSNKIIYFIVFILSLTFTIASVYLMATGDETVVEPCVDGFKGQVVNAELLCEHTHNEYLVLFPITLFTCCVVIISLLELVWWGKN